MQLVFFFPNCIAGCVFGTHPELNNPTLVFPLLLSIRGKYFDKISKLSNWGLIIAGGLLLIYQLSNFIMVDTHHHNELDKTQIDLEEHHHNHKDGKHKHSHNNGDHNHSDEKHHHAD